MVGCVFNWVEVTKDLRFSQRWLWRVLFSVIYRRVVCWKLTEVSEEHIASIFRQNTKSKKISQSREHPWSRRWNIPDSPVDFQQTTWRYIPEDRALQEEYISITHVVTVRFLDCAVVGRPDLTEVTAESSARVCTRKETSLDLEEKICVVPEDRTEAFSTHVPRARTAQVGKREDEIGTASRPVCSLRQ
jgi:hypothetical protein